VTQRIIGLTGGIATGKTTVSNYLSSTYRLPILDADIYARAAITPQLLELLQDRYGSEILQSDRSLDREKLGAIVFGDPQERLWLESQIHPYVREHLVQGINLHFPETIVLVVPLLFEAKMQDLVSETWVVACPPEIEIVRLMQRDRLDIKSAYLRVTSQMPISAKVVIADFVLDNSTSTTALFAQVDLLMSTK
jgi:dephospho-CoA kinase